MVFDTRALDVHGRSLFTCFSTVSSTQSDFGKPYFFVWLLDARKLQDLFGRSYGIVKVNILEVHLEVKVGEGVAHSPKPGTAWPLHLDPNKYVRYCPKASKGAQTAIDLSYFWDPGKRTNIPFIASGTEVSQFTSARLEMGLTGQSSFSAHSSSVLNLVAASET